MLTLTPDVDFDLDFVNARIRDGTRVKLVFVPSLFNCICLTGFSESQGTSLAHA